MSKLHKVLTGILSLMLVGFLCVPVVSFASSDEEVSADSASNEQVSADAEEAAESSQAPATDCVATINYYEYVTYEEPGVLPDEGNRYLLGTRTITGLTENEVLDAWDYVVDIKGYSFFDGWPVSLTVSANSADNVMELFYFRLWDSAYTVNYYLMEGADLTADSWSEALKPNDVEFVKFASETFDGQPFGALVKGDAYEYRIDGAYAIDTYPPEIRVGTDADNNVINVLHAPDSANLPDDMEIIEGVTTPDNGGKPEGGSNGGSSAGGQAPSGSSPLPGDQSFSKDELMAALPDSVTDEEASELFADFIGSEEASDVGQITDDVVDRETAERILSAYNAGLEKGSAAQGDCDRSLLDHLICILIMIILAIIAIILGIMYARERKRVKELRSKTDAEQMEPTGSEHSPDEQV